MFTNEGLVAYANSQLGNPYWYGTFGNFPANESLFNEKRIQYPAQYPPKKWTKESFVVQYGKKVCDCVGLIKGYLMNPTIDASGIVKDPKTASKYNAKYDVSANGMAELAKERGKITTLPETVGLILWKNNHVGIYIGNGYVIEAKGHAYGVVKSRVSDTAWVDWFKCPFIEYKSAKPIEPVTAECDQKMPELYKGMERDEVSLLQLCLNRLGYKGKDGKELKIDGDFGTNTDYAVRSLQKAVYPDCGEADGYVGKSTWAKILHTRY